MGRPSTSVLLFLSTGVGALLSTGVAVSIPTLKSSSSSFVSLSQREDSSCRDLYISSPSKDEFAFCAKNPQCCVTVDGVELLGPAVLNHHELRTTVPIKKAALELYTRTLIESKEKGFPMTRPFTRMRIEILAYNIFSACEGKTINDLEECAGTSIPGGLDDLLIERCEEKGVENPASLPLKYFTVACTFGIGDLGTLENAEEVATKITSIFGDFAEECKAKQMSWMECAVVIYKKLLDHIVEYANTHGKAAEVAKLPVDKILSGLVTLQKKVPQNDVEKTAVADEALQEMIEASDGGTSSSFLLRGSSVAPTAGSFLQMQEKGGTLGIISSPIQYAKNLVHHYTMPFGKIVSIIFGLFLLPLPIPLVPLAGAFCIAEGVSNIISAAIQFAFAPLLSFLKMPYPGVLDSDDRRDDSE
uniref:Uncharacterized protein n=1 Tax=Chromera velia CCMP2878 TaxID=1169474 RepID=A0A0G4FNJ3_9ALVE|eukprot:Cvel_3558.t1-p1 / transcript=Cvel_3558.t1 / gene=Cvel_3558 / organism=Chromera_velia_CCMP2878 / gene_product=hypothetical protein / transcript_product=hypothetical protein / location=Cvel_scaffold145:84414-87844(-) / protein_length=416 / sequence_SO=supercontig / SO=protein_coding / is_pseudo=false